MKERKEKSDKQDATARRFMWEKEVGSVKYKGSSEKLVREARKILSEEINDDNWEEVNKV